MERVDLQDNRRAGFVRLAHRFQRGDGGDGVLRRHWPGGFPCAAAAKVSSCSPSMLVAASFTVSASPERGWKMISVLPRSSAEPSLPNRCSRSNRAVEPMAVSDPLAPPEKLIITVEESTNPSTICE